jgi:hypothetical protein
VSESGDRPSQPVAEPVAATVAREVYWAQAGRTPSDASLGDRLDAYAHRMRVDQAQAVPAGEVLLGSSAGWKRATKLAVWRLTRFSTMRYDRSLADLAELVGQLERRLAATEEELTRLRRELSDRGGGSP